MSDSAQPSGGLSAKSSSLFAQIFAAAWIAVGTILKGVGVIDLDMVEIILSGITIAGCFIPVYFSIIMDKIKDIKIPPVGGANG